MSLWFTALHESKRYRRAILRHDSLFQKSTTSLKLATGHENKLFSEVKSIVSSNCTVINNPADAVSRIATIGEERVQVTSMLTSPSWESVS